VAATLLLALTLAGCESAESRRERERGAERGAMAEAVATATQAAAVPATGLWSEAHLLDRLVRAGVAPRRVEPTPSGPEWMRGDPLVFQAGGGEVWAWIYADSTERRSVTDALDPGTGTPPGRTVPFPPPMVFVTQNNLAAVITGGTERNQDRITLALQAGLPVAAPEGRAP
jgi:hypothetical protein